MTAAPIVLEVVGLPAPQGSKVKMPNGRMLDGTSTTGRANLQSWRAQVRSAAADWCAEHGAAPLTEPVSLQVWFYLPLPASDPYRTRHATAPDASKLLRSTEDALVQGGLLKDDRLICDVTVTKRYASGRPIGAVIKVWPMGEVEASDRAQLKALVLEARRTAKAGVA